jgi:hypothetical protein
MAPGRLALLASTALALSLTLTPAALAACPSVNTSCVSAIVAQGGEFVGSAGSLVAQAGDVAAHPTDAWTDCPGVVFCSSIDPLFGGAPDCQPSEATGCTYAHYRAFGSDGFAWSNGHGGALAPKASDSVVLVGEGQERYANTVTNQLSPCAGPSFAYFEASHKAIGAEPTITFGFGGATASNVLSSDAVACGQGERVQPIQSDLQPGSQFPDGAWTAVKRAGGYTWVLSLGAPVDGLRAVSYSYYTPGNSLHTAFDGTLVEYR